VKSIEVTLSLLSVHLNLRPFNKDNEDTEEGEVKHKTSKYLYEIVHLESPRLRRVTRLNNIITRVSKLTNINNNTFILRSNRE